MINSDYYLEDDTAKGVDKDDDRCDDCGAVSIGMSCDCFITDGDDDGW